ncbi:MAG: hypothetical protein AMXMBFR13_20230 [Phycisphaerae bacterium]
MTLDYTIWMTTHFARDALSRDTSPSDIRRARPKPAGSADSYVRKAGREALQI